MTAQARQTHQLMLYHELPRAISLVFLPSTWRCYSLSSYGITPSTLSCKAFSLHRKCTRESKGLTLHRQGGREARRQSDGAPRAKKGRKPTDVEANEMAFVLAKERERTQQSTIALGQSIMNSDMPAEKKALVIAQLMGVLHKSDKSSTTAGTGPTPPSLETFNSDALATDAAGDGSGDDDVVVASGHPLDQKKIFEKKMNPRGWV